MKRVIFALVILLQLNFANAQTKWLIKDSVLRVPSNFGSWIQRNVGNYNPYIDPIGTRIPSFQLKEIGDFNKDGYNDICMELYLRIFDTNNPSNSIKYQDSLMNYYKGIFINQKNGTYLLDTNYIIHGRGAAWYGGFGDFNGDGLIDYYSNCSAYEFDPKNQDTLFYKYPNRNYSPSHVFINNGKTFDRIDLDTLDMMSGNSDIIDIDKDGKDEIISLPASKFIVYKYDPLTKKFNKSFNNVNDYINKQYGNTIKIFNFYEKMDNSILLSVLRNYTEPVEKHIIDILKINLTDSSITIVNSFKHPTYKLNDGTLSSATIADSKGVFKYEDLNNDRNNELILLGSFTFNNGLSTFQSNQRMGINIIENNVVNTQKYWNYDTTEIGFRIGGNIKDLNNDKISEIIAAEWILDSAKKYFNYYYSLDSGMYKRKYIQTANKIIPQNIYNKYLVWADNFFQTKNSSSQIIIYNPDNLLTNYMYYSINCNDIVVKPLFNSSKFSFCSGDSLKLSITNVNKGDTLRWFYGTKSDLINVTNKTFTDSTKLFVTRTDSLGCVISSDTVSLVKYAIPSAPVLSRDTANNLVANIIGITWYKDGNAITDTTQKIKPTIGGSYTAKTTQNGCISALSNPYYYLVTDIINLSADEYIKLAPNPFSNQLNFDFVVKGYQRLNMEVFDLASGNKVASKQNLTPGIPIYLGQLSAGTYVIKVTSNDLKVSYQFKMVKL
jgi:hypothetical protein